ncbi:M20/M25/M40 family metallo-hydrolase [bacterium]|nr:MAG: M20/M25/M40 family metallo-hydrolase [bacterium]
MFAPILALLVAQYPATSKPVPRAYAKGLRTIVESDARGLVGRLAGPEFMGRGPGQPGFNKAAELAADWFQRYGLTPAGDNGGYFQRMFLSNAKVDGTTAKMEVGDTKFAWGQDYAFAATGNVRLKAGVAFVKLQEGKLLSDADREKLRGRIVIFDPATSRTSLGYQVLSEAQAGGLLGAVALVVPTGSVNVPTARFTRHDGDVSSVTSLAITREAAERLQTAVGGAGTSAVELGTSEAILEGNATVSDEVASMNVVAKIEGSDPKLKSEAVVIGSHLDHLGTSEQGTYWGADDDASGSTANMLIARAFSQNGARPKRTVVFCLWTMEEKGLRGSQFYTAHPAMPLKDTVAYLNMDMVGRDSDNPAWTDRAKENLDAVYASSAKIGSPELYEIVKEANRAIGLNLRDDREDRTMRSDTGSFARGGIPVLKAFTGEHPDYHKMTDTPEKLNYSKMTKVVQWVYLCAQDLANRKGRPGYSATGRYVRGRVRAASDLELPADAVVETTLLEDGKPIDRSQIVNSGHLPQIFTLRYDAAALDPKKRYEVTARVVQKGKVTMSTLAPVLVLQNGVATNNAEVLVEPVKG